MNLLDRKSPSTENHQMANAQSVYFTTKLFLREKFLFPHHRNNFGGNYEYRYRLGHGVQSVSSQTRRASSSKSSTGPGIKRPLLSLTCPATHQHASRALQKRNAQIKITLVVTCQRRRRAEPASAKWSRQSMPPRRRRIQEPLSVG